MSHNNSNNNPPRSRRSNGEKKELEENLKSLQISDADREIVTELGRKSGKVVCVEPVTRLQILENCDTFYEKNMNNNWHFLPIEMSIGRN